MSRAPEQDEYRDTKSIVAERVGVDRWLDYLESNLIALSQRRLTTEQVGRLGKLVERGEEIARAAAPKRRRRAAA